MTRQRPIRPRTAVLTLILSVLVVCLPPVRAVDGNASGTIAKPRLGVFFWHRRGSTINRDEYDAKFPERYEYLELDEWSPDGWAPRKVDIVLEPGQGGDQLAKVSTVRTTISMRIGPLRQDPVTGLTDTAYLETNAVWVPARVVISKELRAGSTAGRLILAPNWDLEQANNALWKRHLWPMELKIDVVLEPLRPETLHEAVISRTLRLLPGD